MNSSSSESNTVIVPSEQGRLLEDIIHNASQKISGLTRTLRELEIRTHFGDSSLNGVDHMMSIGTTHVLIQDKWKETTAQQEVSQFITCAERIQTRLPRDDTIYLIWASKREPTSNSAKMLQERHVSVVCCGVSLEALARCVILQVCECLAVSPLYPLLAIDSAVKPVPMDVSRHTPVVSATIATTATTVPVIAFDDTEGGKREIEAMKQFIASIRNGILRRAETAMSLDGIADIYTLWSSTIPRSMEEWWNGTKPKVDFNGYLKTVKAICWPNNKKHLPFRNLCYYTKLRKLSVEFAPLANEYEIKRKTLLSKKSVWAKGLSNLKVSAEPITEAEFKGAVKDTMDYITAQPNDQMNSYKASINGVSFQSETGRLMSSFHTHQCSAY